ncbi:Putative metallopeptidase, catalytic domain superfamily [Colletotrichum destructivum]|uniref:Metallopeptidase, catalytic domain superfamily n=1 Tax=Colletotrichum destructivum TaxID=34406 RepID=A0AAX4IMG5_9PEZI|nr:Putative metallopeptidase, catalytic domain superfamily [Colletotrichum destructivum]
MFSAMIPAFAHFVSVILLILSLGHGAWSHVLSTHHIRSMEEALHSHNKRALDGYYVIDQQKGSEWGCSEEKIAALEHVIRNAREMASAASKVLERPGSEHSEAYRMWLGEGNSDPDTRTAIKRRNFDPIQNLEPPGQQNRLDDMKYKNFSPTGLTYMCAAEENEACNDGTIASALQHGVNGIWGNVFLLCDRFFERTSYKRMLRIWRSERIPMLASAFTIIHESQHMGAIVGKSRRCTDVKNPKPRPEDTSPLCYHPDCCATLSSKDKIRNAQNMAFFALEVTANPERGEPPELSSCTIMKRDTGNLFSGRLDALLSRADYFAKPKHEGNMLRRQAGSFTTSEIPCASRPPLAIPVGGDALPDRETLPRAVFDRMFPREQGRTSTAAASAPVACHNFDLEKYGYCCPGPGNSCRDDPKKCWVGGEGVGEGAADVVPAGARCQPPPGAVF